MERKLSAILAADVVGYSRLMSNDEAGTFDRLSNLRKEHVQPTIKKNGGRIVKLMGDGLLAEFPSVSNAVECGISIQEALGSGKTDGSEDDPIRLRIGINLGDVIVEGSDIYGDGVNIAARLESISDPGGICISAIVHQSIGKQLSDQFIDLGDQQLKNIDVPVRAFRWDIDFQPSDKVASAYPKKSQKPSIAVLPFDNMSDDPEQEYFADGIVEDIITALSRLDQLFVIARNSSFTYKGRAVDIRQVCRELGVRYVVEGSLRKAGNRLRITCQLIEGETGSHLWADRFDGDLQDVFDLQDRITEALISEIEPTLRNAEIERSRSKRPDSIDAYDLYLQALPYIYAIRPDENLQAAKLLKMAIELDPNYAPALAYTAWCYEQRITRGWDTIEVNDAAEAISLAKRAIAAKYNDASALAAAGFVLLMVGRDYEVGLNTLQHAVSMSANTVPILIFAGWGNNFAGRPEIAAPLFERARRHSPADPLAFTIKTGGAMSHLLMGQPQEAYDTALEAMALNSSWDNTLLVMAAASHQLGNTEQARLAVKKLLEVAPKATVSLYGDVMPFRDRAQAEIILEGLRTGGMPE